MREPKVDIEVFSNKGGRSGAAFLAADALGRLRMSAGLVEMFNLDGRAGKFYLGYDKANKRIALGAPEVVKPTDAHPVTFDKNRHYASVRGYFRRYGIELGNHRYHYDGRYNGWMMFKLEWHEDDDGRGV